MRERWNSRSIFILAAVGSAVGLGNAWRFPAQVFDNGGGAFLIPYFVALITGGIPLLILEHSIGKRFQAGAPTALRKLNKHSEWLGWWALTTSFVIVSYYAVVMSWVINYLWHSLTTAWKDSPGDFFIGDVLKLTSGPGNLGGFSWPIIIGLVLAWISIYYSIRNGVKSVSKIVKWTVPLPVILLVILAVRGLTLNGGIEGINYYLKPDFSVLKDYKVWASAYGQIFFSLSILFGIMIAYASYLKKGFDITSNALVIAFSDVAISFLAGFAVFSTLGYLSNITQTPIAELRYSGVMLAFITYPQAIASLPGGQAVAVIFGLMFFITLFTLGIDSAFSIVEGIVAGLVDKFGWDKKKTVLAVSLTGFAGGLIFSTKAGLYWLDITDYWTNNFNLITIGVVQCIIVGWIFGAKKMRDYINKDSNIRLGAWWDLMIRFVMPLVLLYISVSFIIDNIRTPYGGGDYAVKWLIIGGWAVSALTIIAGFVFASLRGRQTAALSSEEE